MIRSLTVVSAVLVTVGSALGQSSEEAAAGPPADSAGASLAFQLTLGAWLPRLDGTAKLGPSVFAEHIDLKRQVDLHDMETVFNGELTMTVNNDWQILLSGFDFSTEGEGQFSGFSDFGDLRFFTGDRYRASFDISSYAAEWVFPIGEPLGTIAGPAEGETTSLSFAGQLGLRWTEVDYAMESLDFGGSETAGGEWLAPYFGIRFNLQHEPEPAWPLIKRLDIDVSTAAGPSIDGGGGFWQLRAGLTCYFTNNFGLTIGYRLLEMDFSDDEYDTDAGLQGLFAGGSIRF